MPLGVRVFFDYVNTFQQNLQIQYVNGLIAVLGSDDHDQISKFAALYNLQKLRDMMESKRNVNRESQAHAAHVILAIDKALDVSSQTFSLIYLPKAGQSLTGFFMVQYRYHKPQFDLQIINVRVLFKIGDFPVGIPSGRGMFLGMCGKIQWTPPLNLPLLGETFF